MIKKKAKKETKKIITKNKPSNQIEYNIGNDCSGTQIHAYKR